jgi:hypothetical protein
VLPSEQFCSALVPPPRVKFKFVATGCRIYSPVPSRERDFFFLKTSRTDLAPSHPSIQRWTTHLLLVSKSRINAAVLLLPLYTFMACTGKLDYLYTEK